MNNLTITQEFALCLLNPKGNPNVFNDTNACVCVVTSAVWELLAEDIITRNEKKKIVVQKDLSNPQPYLQLIYDTLAARKPRPLAELMQDCAFGSKVFTRFLSALMDSLDAGGCVNLGEKSGLFGSKKLYCPKEGVVTGIVEKIRAEFLEEGDLSDETVMLSALLSQCGVLKNYFSKYESSQLKQRMKEVKDSPAFVLAKEMIDEVIALLVVIIAAT